MAWVAGPQILRPAGTSSVSVLQYLLSMRSPLRKVECEMVAWSPIM
jgi:hypothetical protein